MARTASCAPPIIPRARRDAAPISTRRRRGSLLLINVMGRVFMDALDDPFASVEAQLSACRLREGADAIVVDIHAEATSEKMAMGHFCDGRASLVVGTHQHIPTADAQILPGGTAFQADAGACADYDSVIGMDKTEPVQRFIRKMSTQRYAPATGPATCAACLCRPAPTVWRRASIRCGSADG